MLKNWKPLLVRKQRGNSTGHLASHREGLNSKGEKSRLDFQPRTSVGPQGAVVVEKKSSKK